MTEASIEAYRRNDVPEALSFLDPHVVFDAGRVGVLDTEVAHGHTAVAETVARFVGTFEDYSDDVERLSDLGGGAIVAVATEGGLGRGSGVPSPAFGGSSLHRDRSQDRADHGVPE